MSQSTPSKQNSASKVPSRPMNPAERHKAARENALRIKQVQEAALAALPHRKLYIGLWVRSDPPVANNFHWGFYYHQNSGGGMKYHMKSLGGGWIADHARSGGVFKSQFLCVLIQMGSIPAEKEEKLDQLMRSYDTSSNTIPGLTCRVWVLKIVQLLVQAELVRCQNLASLEQECFDFGNSCMISAARNDQPRPVKVSSQCS